STAPGRARSPLPLRSATSPAAPRHHAELLRSSVQNADSPGVAPGTGMDLRGIDEVLLDGDLVQRNWCARRTADDGKGPDGHGGPCSLTIFARAPGPDANGTRFRLADRLARQVWVQAGA